MSILLDFFGFKIMFIIPSAMLLSVLTGVTSEACTCSSSISVFLIGNDYCAFMYNTTHSDSSDDSITAFITSAKMNIGPLKFLLHLLPK